MRRQNVRRSVINYLKELIFEGKLAAGDRVPQDEVAAALDVSNTPVREALIALEHEGLVTIELHRGAFVNGFDADTVRIQYELFALIWGWAVEKALEKATSQQVDEMLDLGRRARATNDPVELYAIVTSFTDILETVSGSHDWRRLLDRLPRLVPGPPFYEMPGAVAAVADWMEPLAQAMARHDAAEAKSASDRMMYAHGQALLDELERRQLLVPRAD
jgi:DNA-binding GntR family transcriptional regulator